ncbi:MAG: phosphoribosylglycinamide formyltransferase [Actinomycetota bacterium]|nr:phosphoribosylglycinamide formyltransferase [Actinomycetota bacterium]
MPEATRRRRIAVLVSGGGSNLQALLDAIAADPTFGGQVVVVASDQADCLALERARAAGIPSIPIAFEDHPDRQMWEHRLTYAVAGYDPDLIVLAGFMRLLSPRFLQRWPNRICNIHPSLLPAFPGPRAVRDALEYGVKITGTTVHLVDEQVDHGPIIAQHTVEVAWDDDVTSLHERIKQVEHMLLPAVVKLLCNDRVLVEGRRTRVVPAANADALTVLDLATHEQPAVP